MITFNFVCKLLIVACLGALVTPLPTAQVPEKKSPAPAPHWNYEDPKVWKEHFSSCGGEHQSPINLDLSKAVVMEYDKFNFHNYDKVFREMLTNNGHTVMMRVEEDKNHVGEEVPFITGGGLANRYNFVQLHFHWGKDTLRGSEHHINGRQYPAELHLVHYNTKYGGFTEATAFPDGLAVLGIMIELEARDNTAFRHLELFNEVINPDATKSSFLPYSVPLVDLLPDSTLSFYRYNGSLTTPGCNEDVIWTVFDTPIAISDRQLNKFRRLHDAEGHQMEDNFRPVQELHDRVLTYRPDDFVNPA